jgi:alcohol dehydrogenase YqhD (iron-dependent ADH family)
MTNFEFCVPTRVLFGRGAEQRCGELAAACGAKKALVHYGGGSAEASGLLGRVCDSLKQAGVGSVLLGGVRPNPRLELVYQGIELCKKEGVDFILAVGGGSVIDSGKAIGYGLANEGDVWDFYAGVRKPLRQTPLGTVLTLAAAGSEMSNSTVITNEALGQKRGFNDELGRPLFAVMNPELTLTVPLYHTLAGCADILMHTLERYFTAEPQTMELTDALAEALMRTVLGNAAVLSREPDNYNARAEVMWAGALSHNGLTGLGAGAGDWAPHQLGHELSARYDMSHGASLTTVWGSWARYVYKQNPERFARLAVNVLDMPDEGPAQTLALDGIAELENLFWGLELPTSIEEAGFDPSDEEIHAMAVGCSRQGARTIGGFKPLNQDDMEAIYQMARHGERG